MPTTLETENLKLRRDLSQLLSEARRNEDIMRRHQQLDLQFIGADSFQDLISTVFESLPASSELDVVTLVLLDPQYDIRRILAELRITLSEFPNLLFYQEASELGDIHQHLHRAHLGPYSEEKHGALFPEPVTVPVSVAVLPLIRNHQLIGTLNIGSFQASRFAAAMATDFIMHLASIVAICIENVINSERLKHIGLTDPLTGVNNRRYVERRLLEEIGRSHRQSSPLSCIYIDIDHFKRVNDELGHQAGDEVLREVAMRIKAELRLSDALGRFGGEEFVVLLIDAEAMDASIVAERIRAGIADTPLVLADGKKLTATVSLGIASLKIIPGELPVETVARQLVARADEALYQAKAGGRNRVVTAGD